MKTIANAFLLAVALILISPVRAADEDAAKRDLAQLQGEWRMTSGVADGNRIPDPMLANSKRICKGDQLTAIVGGQLVMKAKITLDPSNTPKAIDYDVTDGPNKGKKLLGIYEVTGDTFKSCFAAPGEPRPADFVSNPGDKRTSTVWKRANAATRSSS
jgi:uncharacterized protein (TIGR03067 family)